MPSRQVDRLDQYELLDFGGGRKLERFGRAVLDRCSPAAVDSVRFENDWSDAEVRLDDRGEVIRGHLPIEDWPVRIADIQFNLKITPFGHVGVFPEQAENWQWLQSLGETFVPTTNKPPLALNLFAYTGGSTMALAKAGFEVVHVDASAPSVRWARDNAASNQLHDHPIRWIVEDARKFAARELKRDRRYHVIVLDPPSFGHGPSGGRWEIESDLYPLLESCLQLLHDKAHLLLTAHSIKPSPADIIDWLHHTVGHHTVGHHTVDRRCNITSKRLTLVDRNQRHLDSGFCIRFAN